MIQKIWIGVLFLEKENFIDEENKTIGKPLFEIQEQDNLINGKTIFGDVAMSQKVFLNRRKVTGNINMLGYKKMINVQEYLERKGLKNITFKWDINAGCSMCPCSPGFKIFAEFDKDKKIRSARSRIFWLRINDYGDLEFDFNHPDIPPRMNYGGWRIDDKLNYSLAPN